MHLSSVKQWGAWAVLLWPCLLTMSIPLDCKEEQGSLSRCLSISQEKLLDRVIQHAELIYRVSEESCSMFVSKSLHLHTSRGKILFCFFFLIYSVASTGFYFYRV